MLVGRQMHLEAELLKWMLLTAIAIALMLAAASSALGIESTAESIPPRLLLPEMSATAKPLDQATNDHLSSSWTQESSSQSAEGQFCEQAGSIWRAIDCLRGDIDPYEAIVAWSQLRLADDMEVWREVALAVTYLRAGELTNSDRALDTARALTPNSAVVHYLTGVLRLTQATLASDWNDAMGPTQVRYVVRAPRGVVPNSRSMYRLLASMEFEKAIEHSDGICPYQALVESNSWCELGMPMVAPMVGDLLKAMKADSFEAKAHEILGQLHLERGALDIAEQHMDQAVAELDVVETAYRELGDQYADMGRRRAALRAYVKALKQREGVVGPTQGILQLLHKAFSSAD